MEKSLRELLLKDLCSRLPYGVLCKSGNEILPLKDVYIDGAVGNEGQLRLGNCKYGGIYKSIEKIKPYLRPMSSMTEEEKREAMILWNEDFVDKVSLYHCYPKTTDFYNKHHFDYRGLIEKGLAIEAPEDMYK